MTAIELMDTGILNEHMKAYFRLALIRAGVSSEDEQNIMNNLREVMDNYTAEEALSAYLKTF